MIHSLAKFSGIHAESIGLGKMLNRQSFASFVLSGGQESSYSGCENFNLSRGHEPSRSCRGLDSGRKGLS